MKYIKATCNIGNGHSLTFKLKVVSEDARWYLLEHVHETIQNHNLLSRCFNTLNGAIMQYPNYIHGSFQKSYYRGDTNSDGSQWIQHLMTSSDKYHFLYIERKDKEVAQCVYAGYKPLTLHFYR